MRIMFDRRSIGSIERSSGVGNYSINLINSLSETDEANSYELFFFGSRYMYNYSEDLKIFNLPIKRIRLPNRVMSVFSSKRGKSFIPADIMLGYPGIIHCLSPMVFLPSVTKSKLVVTVHDLTFIIHPETHSNFTLRMNGTIRKSLKSADAIISDSLSTKKDLIKHLEIEPNRIFVIPLSTTDSFRPMKEDKVINEVKRRYKIDGNYILALGSLEPRKNLSRLIEAYESLRKTSKIKEKLVIVGQKGWLFEPIFEKALKSDLKSDLIFTDYIPNQDVAKLLNGAQLLIYPSIYEGFGLPILEAMSCGTPVVTSKSSSLPEVGGKAAYYIDPYDVKDIANGIMTVLGDERLRNNMSIMGLHQARKFSWKKAAKQTIQVYEKVWSEEYNR